MKFSIMIAIVTCVVTSACGGPVSVSGTFGDRTLNVSGTAVAWIDETEYVVDTDGGTPVLKDRQSDAVVMHLLFTEAVFDPLVDFRALPAGERASIFQDIERGDALFIDIRRGNTIRVDDSIPFVPNDGRLPPEVLPFMEKIEIDLGEYVLTPSASYPERVERVASKLTSRFKVTSTSPELAGRITMEAEKNDGEGDGFLEGEVTLTFTTELLPERLAECNFAELSQGVVSACDLD